MRGSRVNTAGRKQTRPARMCDEDGPGWCWLFVCFFFLGCFVCWFACLLVCLLLLLQPNGYDDGHSKSKWGTTNTCFIVVVFSCVLELPLYHFTGLSSVCVLCVCLVDAWCSCRLLSLMGASTSALATAAAPPPLNPTVSPINPEP